MTTLMAVCTAYVLIIGMGWALAYFVIRPLFPEWWGSNVVGDYDEEDWL